MSAPQTLSLREMHTVLSARAPRITARIVQYWTRPDIQVLQPTRDTLRQGKGAHHRFDLAEAVIGLVVVELDRLGLPWPQMKWIAEAVRGAMSLYQRATSLRSGEELAQLMAEASATDQVERGWCIAQARSGVGVTYLAAGAWEDAQGESKTQLALVRPNASEDIHLGGGLYVQRMRHAGLAEALAAAGPEISSFALIRLDRALEPWRLRFLSPIAL